VKLVSFEFSTHHHLSVLIEILSSRSTMSSCLVFLYYLGEGKISE